MPLVSMSKDDPNLGSMNQYVMLLQRFLVLNGDLERKVPTAPDPVNGKFDDATRLAVESFQGKRGVPVSGIVKGHTWAAIAGVASDNAADDLTFVDPDPSKLSTKELPLLRFGDEDSVVTVLQRLLLDYSKTPLSGILFVTPSLLTQEDIINSLGKFGGKTVGKFDRKTEQAVISFQVAVNNFDTTHPTPPLPSLAQDGKVDSNTWHRLIFPKKV